MIKITTAARSKYMAKLSFKPKQITKKLLGSLPERAREVIEGRYGLGKSAETLTLEAIGGHYGITRERVRQIENYGLNTIRKSEAFEEATAVFDELKAIIEEMGGIVGEEELLASITKEKSAQQHLHFLLVLGVPFVYEKEDSEFHHRWYTDKQFASRIQNSLRALYKELSDEDLIPEHELINRFLDEVKEVNDKSFSEEIVRRWLSLSKNLGRNPLGEWGRANSPNVRAKGMRDYAYLVIKRHGSPMHFKEVARAITELFNKKAHGATCHNELIKDQRFVLVGRGLYALKEWGYSGGVVKDVIRDLLEEHGALKREDIIDRVRKERYVKDNTIIVNLQDASLFKRQANGTYILVEQ